MRGLSTFLRNLYLDMRDQGARRAGSSNSLDLTKAALGLAVPLLGAVPPLVRYVVGSRVAPYAAVAFPILLLWGSLHVISRKKIGATLVATPTSREIPAPEEYEYPQLLRRAAKGLCGITLALLVYNSVGILPNAVMSRHRLVGYLCAADLQAPMPEVAVRAVDQYNNEVSVGARERTDSFGYFVLDLRPLAFAPEGLRVSYATCLDMSVPLKGSEFASSCNRGDSAARPSGIYYSVTPCTS
jgi:hypothetical protein